MLLSRRIVELYSIVRHEFVEDGECHIRIHAAGSVAHEQGDMHHFANLTGLHDDRGLPSLPAMYEVMMHR